ncbi:GAP family protein [Promicromonospora sp. NPDC059942]|uniref:GAP family protein n=1 Tax=Promicromonospora sp. NPDC059942 TaxID=3347009 RepID=UPI003649CD50
MGDMLVALLPEIVGLAVTPAAIIACLLLLGSVRPYRNVAVFGGTVLVVYSVLGVVALVIGNATGARSAGPAGAGWVSLVVGVLFLAVGLVAATRRPAPESAGRADAMPAWARKLSVPTVPVLMGIAVVLALVNPNVAILVSGLTTVVTSDVPLGTQELGVLILVVASVLDYVIPTALYAAAGIPGRRQLRDLRFWLIRRDRVIGAVVLLVFGVIFTARGLSRLLA